MKLDTNNHLIFKLSYHLVLVIKYRRKVIDDISNRLKEIFEYISPKYFVSKMKIVLYRQFKGLIKYATISKTSSNQYYISILVDAENI